MEVVDSESGSSDPEYLPSSEDDFEESEEGGFEEGSVPSWEKLFNPPCATLEDEVDFSLDSLLRTWETGIPREVQTPAALERHIVLPRLDADQFKATGFQRVDVDSIKGLVSMKQIARVFHPDPSATFRLNLQENAAYVKVSLQTCLPKSAEHLRGTGFESGRGASKPSSVLSIPKVPKPALIWSASDDSSFPWPFPEPSVNTALEWTSLADLPYFLLGQAHGGRTEDINLWCICPAAYCLDQPVCKCKAVAQKALHKSKALALDALAGMIEIWKSQQCRKRGEMHVVSLLTPI